MTDHTHKHPRRMLTIRTRTRTSGTLNLALALGGSSCGWGTCAKPRRTFVGRHRGKRPPYHRAIEVEVCGVVLLRIPLGSGPTTWRGESRG